SSRGGSQAAARLSARDSAGRLMLGVSPPRRNAMLGPQDIWIALALGVFFFGAKKLPELSRSLGQALTEFKKGLATRAKDEAPRPEDAATKTEGTLGEETGHGKPPQT